jgi:hypothetical protein
MLGKLIKHELRATARIFLPLFLIAIALAPITRFTLWFGDYPGLLGVIPRIIAFAFVCSLIVIVCASVLLIIYQFYKSMVTREGYLMHTLPVSTESQIFSKLIVSSIWIIASNLVIFLSLFIMFFTTDPDIMSFFKKGIVYFSTFISESSWSILVIAEGIFLGIWTLFTFPLVFYASIAIGQGINKHKIFGSVIGFFIIQIATQVVGAIVTIPCSSIVENISDSVHSSQYVIAVALFIFIILSILNQVILFGITDYIFKKKLNLE